MAWRARRESKQRRRFVSDFISFPVAKKAKTCKLVETQYEIDVTEARKRLEIHSRASALNSMCDVKERLYSPFMRIEPLITPSSPSSNISMVRFSVKLEESCGRDAVKIQTMTWIPERRPQWMFSWKASELWYPVWSKRPSKSRGQNIMS